MGVGHLRVSALDGSSSRRRLCDDNLLTFSQRLRLNASARVLKGHRGDLLAALLALAVAPVELGSLLGARTLLDDRPVPVLLEALLEPRLVHRVGNGGLLATVLQRRALLNVFHGLADEGLFLQALTRLRLPRRCSHIASGLGHLLLAQRVWGQCAVRAYGQSRTHLRGERVRRILVVHKSVLLAAVQLLGLLGALLRHVVVLVHDRVLLREELRVRGGRLRRVVQVDLRGEFRNRVLAVRGNLAALRVHDISAVVFEKVGDVLTAEVHVSAHHNRRSHSKRSAYLKFCGPRSFSGGVGRALLCTDLWYASCGQF